MKKSIILGIILSVTILTVNTISAFSYNNDEEDFDPLVNISVTVEIKQIRSLVTSVFGHRSIDKIDLISDPDFYVKVYINEKEFISPVWNNQKYVYNPDWSATLDVPDDKENVNITIQLWDKNIGIDRICDISGNEDNIKDNYDIDLTYNIKSGHWTGDDNINHGLFWGSLDNSGYGRLNGCDDNSIYQNNRDCEIWFDIYQDDPDGDRIPYWTELNVFNTDPELDDTGRDDDHDGVPIEWEYKWGHFLAYDWHNDEFIEFWFYDPFVWEDHENLDPDEDGLNNIEEYKTSQWGSDPFRKDLFIELDQMVEGTNGEVASLLPEGSKELMKTAFNKHNIVYHLDDGCMGGGEKIPFEAQVNRSTLGKKYYDNYFLHNDENNWRKGVFHYGLVVYDGGYNGFAIRRDAFQISTKYLEEKSRQLFMYDKAVIYASVYMHETGHTLDIRNPGVDNQYTMYPFQRDWWRWGPYKSCMNYRYTYRLVDYSDGSRGMNDFDDWNDIDLTYFDQSSW